MLDDRTRALALLKANHRFPVEYYLSVITVSEEAVFVAVRAAVEQGLPVPLGEAAHVKTPSRGGKYTSHRFRVMCQTPEDVLLLYHRVKQVSGVVTVM